MLQVDVLSGYVICGAGALVGAAMLRIAETNEPHTQAALRTIGWGLVALGLGLLPAGLGADVAHPAAQFSLGFGTLAALAVVARGLGQIQGRVLQMPWVVTLAVASAAGCWSALLSGPRSFGIVFAAGLAGIASLIAWQARGFVTSPRDTTERALAACFIALTATAWVRLAFTLDYSGPPRPDIMYVPELLRPVLAVLYGVLPMIVATLLLNLVNSRLRQQLRTRASTDELTGAMTRRALRELAPVLIEHEQQLNRVVAALMLDLDRFKDINDNFGHHVGDLVLQRAAAALRANMRVDTLLARYGGEEFVAIVPVEDLPNARRVAERLRGAIEHTDWTGILPSGYGVTVSLGVTILNSGETLDTALTRADEALYRAKRDGRNLCRFSLATA